MPGKKNFTSNRFNGANSSDPICMFLHIPKCAGTTFNMILNRQYKSHEVLRIDGEISAGASHVIEAIPQGRRNRLRCIRGHYPFGIHNSLQLPVRYITFLRDPVDRVISYWHFARRNPRHYLHRNPKGFPPTLEALLESGVTPEIENGMTRQLSGLAEFDRIEGRVPVTEECFKEAAKNLQTFAVVGQVERFDESILVMKDIFCWGRVFYFRKMVAKPDRNRFRSRIKQSLRNCIEDLNIYDRKLFELGYNILSHQLAKQNSKMKARVRRFRFYNRFYETVAGTVYRGLKREGQ